MDKNTVVIVGAGLSGIAAASCLLKKGIDNIVVLEAENRIGGRIHTVSIGEVIDLGAHWIGGQIGNPIYELAGEFLTNSKDFQRIEFVLDDGSTISESLTSTLFRKIDEFSKDMEGLMAFRGNLYDYFNHRLLDLLPQLKEEFPVAFMDWFSRFQCLQRGCNSLKEVSPSTLVCFECCKGPQNLIWKSGGYQNIFDLIIEQQPVLLDKILFSKQVSEIDWSNDEVNVKCTDNDTFTCDHVVVTVSLGVLKEKAKTLFNPALPHLTTNTIENLGIGVVNKIFLKYHTKWWPDGSGFCFINTTNDKSGNETDWEREIVGFFTEQGSPTVLCAWITGAAAIKMESEPDEIISIACTRVLRKFLSKRYSVPNPEMVLSTKWYSNENFRGSYSFRSTDSDKFSAKAADLAAPVLKLDKPMIYFAGEAASEKYFSTAHGAYESGWKTGEKIANFYIANTEEASCLPTN